MPHQIPIKFLWQIPRKREGDTDDGLCLEGGKDSEEFHGPVMVRTNSENQ